MPGIDELLRSEGEQWRTEIDARRPAATAEAAELAELAQARTVSGRLRRVLARRPPARRLALWSASACGAAALVAGLAALGGGSHDSAGSSSTRAMAGGAAAPAASSAAKSALSCAAPTLGVDGGAAGSGDSLAGGSSQAPIRVTVGQPLTITGVRYDSPTCEQARSSAPTAQDAVTLRLHTAGRRTVTLVRAKPVGADRSFRVRVTIPADVAPGAATLDDGRGQVVRLTIVAR